MTEHRKSNIRVKILVNLPTLINKYVYITETQGEMMYNLYFTNDEKVRFFDNYGFYITTPNRETLFYMIDDNIFNRRKWKRFVKNIIKNGTNKNLSDELTRLIEEKG